MFAQPVHANDVDKGLKAFNAANYDEALRLWLPKAKAGDPAAQNDMGVLWENGSTTATPRDIGQASQWYLLSAQQGFPMAMTNLGRVQLDVGLEEAGKSWLLTAARWNEAGAKQLLQARGWDVPAPDLAIAQAQNQQANAMAAGAFVLCAITHSCGYQAPAQTTVVGGSFLDPPAPKECRYWTTQGWRVMQAISGVCPAHYGD